MNKFLLIIFLINFSITISFSNTQYDCPKEIQNFGWVHGTNAILRTSPDIKSKIIEIIPWAQKVDILSNHKPSIESFGKSEEYIKIKYDNKIGWTVLGNIFPTPKSSMSIAELKKIGKPLYFEALLLDNNDNISIKKIIPCMKNLSDITICAEKFMDIIPLLENLPNLKRLYISSDGIIPSSLGNLSSLESLTFKGSDTEIPNSVGKLRKLKELNISGGAITKLPNELGDLKNLKRLTIEKCKLLTSLPKSLGNLEKLEYLSISANNLNTIPKELENLKNLKSFYFNESKIKTLNLNIVINPKYNFSKMKFNPEWGIGIIAAKFKPKKEDGRFPGSVFPREKIKLYSKPNGELIGYCWNSYSVAYSLINSDITKLEIDDMTEIDYDEYYLKCYDVKENYMLILFNSTGNGYWISIDEIKDRNFYLVTWQEFFNKKLCCYHIIEPTGMNLREGPSTENKIITLMKNDKQNRFSVKLTGKFKGPWAEAEVEQSVPGDCGRGKLIKKYKGWFKYIDDKLFPNIWYNPKGC